MAMTLRLTPEDEEALTMLAQADGKKEVEKGYDAFEIKNNSMFLM
jgi:hypothetical protein